MRGQEEGATKGDGGNRAETVWTALVTALVAAGVYLYVLLRIEPRLIYEGFGVVSEYPVFAADSEFALRHLAQPGGLLRYTAAFFSHSLHIAWLGALVFTAGLASLQLGLWTFVRRTMRVRPLVLTHVPSVLLLASLGRYQWPLIDCLALSAAVWCGCLYAVFSNDKWWTRWALFTVVLTGLYHAVGAASHAFVFLAVLCEFCRRRTTPALPVYLAVGVGLPWLLGARFYELTPADSFFLLLPFGPHAAATNMGTVRALYLSVPAVPLLSAVWSRLPAAGLLTRMARHPRVRRLARVSILAAMFMVGASRSFDAHAKSAHRLLYCSRHGLWDELLDVVRETPPELYGLYCNHELNKALYHKGRLAYDMFAYRQKMDALLLFRLDDHSSWKWSRVGELAFCIGDLTYAEKMACEVVENKGPSPPMLKMLALVHAAKGRVATARVFLRALQKDLVHGGWATNILAQLAVDPRLETHPEVKRLRRAMIKEGDSLSPGMGEELFLGELVDSDPTNRMALEYLMAFYLLTRQIDRIAANIGRLVDCGYTEIPTLYEEAILIYQLSRRTQVDLRGLQIKPATLERFNRYHQIARRCGRDTRTLRRELGPEFGRSFFFYFHFFESGVGG